MRYAKSGALTLPTFHRFYVAHGNAEERAAEFIRHEMNKPVVGYIAGVTAPKGKRMGHAGAIISGGSGSAEDKFRAFDKAGMAWTRNPALLGETLWNVIK